MPTYVFKHALVQEAAYGSLLVERRRAIHGRVAAAIERLFAERAEEFTSMLAFHYVLAEDWPKAHDYLLKAGDQSGRMAADAEALEHYRRAETTYMKSGAEALSHLERATLDRKLGQALYGVGRYEEAVEHLSRALAQLGVRYPRSRAGVRRSIAAALGRHFLRRIGGRQVTRTQLDFATAQEISAAAHLLSWLDFFVDAEQSGMPQRYT
jgi:tetratricopeptide (TPR) repeat protein